MPKEDQGTGTVETAFGRVTFSVARGSTGSLTIPRGTVLTFQDGRVLGTLDHVVQLNGFTPTTVGITENSDRNFENLPAVAAGLVTVLSTFPETLNGGPPAAKRALDRLLEDDDLV